MTNSGLFDVVATALGVLGTLFGIVGFFYGVWRDRTVSEGDKAVLYHQLVAELNSEEFRAVVNDVNQAMAHYKSQIPQRYFSRTQPTRQTIDRVFQMWDRIGLLLKHKRVSEATLLSYVAYASRNDWDAFAPIIEGLRKADKNYLEGFAYLKERSDSYVANVEAAKAQTPGSG